MGHSTARQPGSDDYLVLDDPGNSCSVLLNLDLLDALKRFGKRGLKGPHRILGILLGRTVQSGSNRTLVTIEDCHALNEQESVTEHLGFWRTENTDGRDAVGLLSAGAEDDAAFFNANFAHSAAVLLVVVPKRGAVPLARVFWSESGAVEPEAPYSEIPLDSSTLRSGGFTILRGTQSTERRAGHAATGRPRRRWAWTPLAAALCAILLAITATYWALYGPPNQPSEESVDPTPAEEAARGPVDSKTRISEPAPAPTSQKTPPRKRSSAVTAAPPPHVSEPESAPVATPAPAPPPRTDRRRRPAPSTVSVELNAAPYPVGRSLRSRMPGLPLFRRLYSKDGDDLVPASPTRQPKPAVPMETAREFPGEWRVDLRLIIDKSGQVTQTALLSPNANREFVMLARDAIDNWEFEPARLRQRPVSSALDITFRFRNPVSDAGERVGR